MVELGSNAVLWLRKEDYLQSGEIFLRITQVHICKKGASVYGIVLIYVQCPDTLTVSSYCCQKYNKIDRKSVV